MLQQRKCTGCHSLFIGGPRAFYCPSCREIRRKERDRKRKKTGPVRPLGSIDECIQCGNNYIVVGGMQRFCPKCAPIHAREHDRVTSLQFYHANKNRINPIRYIRRKVGLIPCIECGKIFDPQGTRRRYCGDTCRRKRINRVWMDRYYQKRLKGGKHHEI